MDMADNIESLYNRKIELYDRWMSRGDALSEVQAYTEAHRLARSLARTLESGGHVRGRYTLKDIALATDEIMKGFPEHQHYAVKRATERPREPVAPQPMTAGEVEHAQKYEALARKIGIEDLQALIPASREQVQKAIETGDRHLGMIPLVKWDRAAAGIQVPGLSLSLSEKVCVLKHVATWHYA
jgi:hypothetical protein